MATLKQVCTRMTFGEVAKACGAATRRGEQPSTRECVADVFPQRVREACGRPGAKVPEPLEVELAAPPPMPPAPQRDNGGRLLAQLMSKIPLDPLDEEGARKLEAVALESSSAINAAVDAAYNAWRAKRSDIEGRYALSGYSYGYGSTRDRERFQRDRAAALKAADDEYEAIRAGAKKLGLRHAFKLCADAANKGFEAVGQQNVNRYALRACVEQLAGAEAVERGARRGNVVETRGGTYLAPGDSDLARYSARYSDAPNEDDDVTSNLGWMQSPVSSGFAFDADEITALSAEGKKAIRKMRPRGFKTGPTEGETLRGLSAQRPLIQEGTADDQYRVRFLDAPTFELNLDTKLRGEVSQRQTSGIAARKRLTQLLEGLGAAVERGGADELAACKTKAAPVTVSDWTHADQITKDGTRTDRVELKGRVLPNDPDFPLAFAEAPIGRKGAKEMILVHRPSGLWAKVSSGYGSQRTTANQLAKGPLLCALARELSPETIEALRQPDFSADAVDALRTTLNSAIDRLSLTKYLEGTQPVRLRKK